MKILSVLLIMCLMGCMTFEREIIIRTVDNEEAQEVIDRQMLIIDLQDALIADHEEENKKLKEANVCVVVLSVAAIAFTIAITN